MTQSANSIMVKKTEENLHSDRLIGSKTFSSNCAEHLLVRL